MFCFTTDTRADRQPKSVHFVAINVAIVGTSAVLLAVMPAIMETTDIKWTLKLPRPSVFLWSDASVKVAQANNDSDMMMTGILS